MLHNYFLIALRNLNRQVSYSLINIIGLAIGLACSLVIFMYIYGEWSYDRHFNNADRIHRIGVAFFNLPPFAVGPEALGENLPKEFEGIEAFTRVARDPSVLFTKGDQSFHELAYYTDSTFFKVFSYEFIQGDFQTALTKPGSMVMTKRVAEKYFKGADPLGQVVTVGKDKKLFIVTGIVKDNKSNSQLKSSIWLSNENVLTDGMGVPKNISFEEYKNHTNAVRFFVHGLQDVHLKSTLNYEISPTGNESNLYTFADSCLHR